MTRPVVTESEHVGSAPVIHAPAFVGRDRELTALTQALATPPAMVMIEGEAGIGKSRLVAEFLASPSGRPLCALAAPCPPLSQPCTLAPIVEGVRQAAETAAGLPLSALAGALRPLFPEWAGQLPPPPEPAGDATAARHRVFRALAELLGCLNVSLLVVEDAHWADQATLEFLLLLASRTPPPVSLVVTCRPGDVPPGSPLSRLSARVRPGTAHLRLALGPLNLGQTTSLVSSMLAGEPISGEFAAFVSERTEGVPLAVEESVRLMADRGDLIRRDGQWVRHQLADIQVPPTVRDAVLERAARLGQQAQAVLQAAAVLAEPASEDTLAVSCGLPPGQARAGLGEALRSGLLGEGRGGLSSFRHVLAGQAVYEAIPAPDRRVMHQRAAQALEGRIPRPLAQLARHFREAGDTAAWCRYAEQAADFALASGDAATAADLLHDLIIRADLSATSVVRLTRKLPFSAVKGQHRFRALLDALESVLATRALEPGEEAGIRVQLGLALTMMQEWARARAQLERAIPHLAHDPAARAQAMMLLAWPRGTTCPRGVHIRWLRRAAGVAVSMESADYLRFAVDRATALLLLGVETGWAEAARLPLDAPTAEEMWEITRSHLNIGDQAVRWGRYGEAAWRLREARDLASSREYRGLYDAAVVTQMHLDWFTGAWEGLAGRAASLASGDDIHPVTRLEAALIAGLLDAAAGARAQADEQLRMVCQETEQRAEMEYAMEPAAALARLRLADGRADDALKVTEAPITIVARKGIWLWAADLAPARVAALAAAGRADEASELVTAFAKGLRARNAPAPTAGLLTCRALLAEAHGEHARAGQLFARADAAWQALPRPYDALLARERQADCLLASGKTGAGWRLLTEAEHGLSHLGARADADRVAGSLRGHGVVVPRVWQGGRRGYGNELSPREREVVQLVIAGHTNREIARILYRSPRTVAGQLHSAMRKLGVSSRTALAVSVLGGEDAASRPPQGNMTQSSTTA